MFRSRLFAVPVTLAMAVGIALGTAGCSSTVSMTPAKGANDPACAAVISRLPATVDGQQRRWTDAQATGAWGSPASVLLTCGLDAPGPSTLVCQTVDGIDWLMDDTQAPKYRFTSFGRTPAVQVYLDYDVVGGRDVLSALSSAVQQLPTDGRSCTDRPSS
ncbi:DUF3515 family protein [Microbacterium sp. VKM Ac-2870]|uniref:DUF3515 family protein n=1 Tax=Microbacterium sp. VKM Ac-2870 TaxID=2783825 RepID=UPI002B278325|nr:DUF3515 family protein [Microbacterium sp. VKM Ac-2870]